MFFLILHPKAFWANLIPETEVLPETKTWYSSTLPYPYFKFYVYFLKFLSFIFFLANLVPKSEALQINWHLVEVHLLYSYYDFNV